MKIVLLIILFFIPCSFLWSEDDIGVIDLQAQAFFEAQDYIKAYDLYTQLLNRSLPTWQEARLYYNLGTILLAQQQVSDAFHTFQQIFPLDLSLPRFASHLFLNEGIAYFIQAHSLANPQSLITVELQILLTQQTLQALNDAYTLNCQSQAQEPMETPCLPDQLIGNWIKKVRLQLQCFRQQKRNLWLMQASIESLASLIQQSLQKLGEQLQTFKQEKQSSVEISYESFLQHQGETLLSLWNALQQQEFSSEQKMAFDQAFALYLSLLDALSKREVSLALTTLNQASEALSFLTFQQEASLQKALLNYHILFLQDFLTLSKLQDLKDQFDHLETKETPSLTELKKRLQLSVEALKQGHDKEARFFFLAGFSFFDALFPHQKVSSAANILTHALDQAMHTLQLFFLWELIEKTSEKRGQMQTILKQQQHAVLIQATPFIPAVLQEQTLAFQQTKNLLSRCQQTPWDQVIPLFDQGNQAAKKVEKSLTKPSVKQQEIFTQMGLMVQNWQQALDLLLHPPVQKQENTSTSEQASYSQNLNETLELLQEMYLQDQFQPPQAIQQELHSW